MIIREFKCRDCGALFESAERDPECPSCTGEEPERVFMTAPAIRSPKTSVADRTLKELASDYGLSDMNNKHGQAVKGGGNGQFTNSDALKNFNIPADARDGFSPLRGDIAGRGPTTWKKTPYSRSH